MQGAIAGMLAGTATVLIWHNLLAPLGGIFGIYELLPAFIVSLIFIVVVSLLTPEPSKEVLETFDHYMDEALEDEEKAALDAERVQKATGEALGD